jgi:hypothetical protein
MEAAIIPSEAEAQMAPSIVISDRRIKALHPGKMLLEGALKTAFESALSLQGKLDDDVLNIDGMSGKKYRVFINNLISLVQNPRYLEVGSWTGSTLCSAIHKNALTAVAIDNWSQYGGPVSTFFSNISRHCSPDTKLSVISKDFRTVAFEALGRFNVYLFDGPHEYADQYDGLAMALNCLDNEFIYIVDDWNWEQVRTGTSHAIANLNLEIVHSIEIRTTADGSHPKVRGKDSDWHNGYFISLLRK